MTLALIISLALFSSPSPVRTHVEHFAKWRLRISKDTFTAQTHCDLKQHDVQVTPQLVTFSLGGEADTSQVALRMDNAAPLFIRSSDQSLPTQPNVALLNPSMGEVRLPLNVATKAHQIAIETHPGAPIALFNLTGLTQALNAANQAGCKEYKPF